MRFRTVFGLLVSAASCVLISGCGTTPGTETGFDGPAGEVGLQIDLGKTGIKSVQYVITGAAGFNKVGTVDVSKSSTVSTRVGGLPSGSDYTIALSATATDPPATCSGSAGFDITPSETTPVDLTLQCVEINADFNTCPVVDGLSALPTQVAVGGLVTINAEVHDPDSGPSPLSYSWSNSLGSLTSSGAAATLTCDTTGIATVTLAVNDGGSDCTTSQSVVVTCGDALPPVGQAVPFPTPFVALLAAQLLALGAQRSRRARKRSPTS